MAKKDLPRNSRHDRSPAWEPGADPEAEEQGAEGVDGTGDPVETGLPRRPSKRAALHDVPDRAAVERAHLVGVVMPGEDRATASRSLAELGALVVAAGGEVAGETLQARLRIDAATYIGKGKVEELRDLCSGGKASLVVFDHDLSPAQARNVEEELKIKVIDRSEMILDIFAKRARTSIARSQVELAQLEYQLPRLTNLWTHLSRLGGGIGTRGPGETQLEVDRRRVRERIKHLKETLRKVERVREVQRKGRRNLTSVALVGYTNAGKSSLMNALSDANVFVENRVFATLDTTTRMVTMEGATPILLTDTVGFIRKLPHQLIASFHATLEEVITADLLLVVVDGSDPDHAAHLDVVNEVLEEIGAGNARRLLVVNKCDQITSEEEALRLVNVQGPGVMVSATTGEGLDALRLAIGRMTGESRALVRVDLPYTAARDLAELHARAEVVESDYTADAVRVLARVRPEDIDWLRRQGYRVTPS